MSRLMALQENVLMVHDLSVTSSCSMRSTKYPPEHYLMCTVHLLQYVIKEDVICFLDFSLLLLSCVIYNLFIYLFIFLQALAGLLGPMNPNIQNLINPFIGFK